MKKHEGCRHYWVIATSSGPVSEGRCKLCGAKKEFYTSFYLDFVRHNKNKKVKTEAI
jgi:hypothetical protein